MNNSCSGDYIPPSMKETATFFSSKADNTAVCLKVEDRALNSAKALKNWSNKINGTANMLQFLHSWNSLVDKNLE